MKTLWTCLIQSSVLAAGLVCSADVFAQQPKEPDFPPETSAPPPEQGPVGGHRRGMMDPAQQLAGMTKRYNLSADQQNQVKPILVDQQQQMLLLHLDSSLSLDEKKAKMQNIRSDSDKKLAAILNDDQKKQFEQDHQSRNVCSSGVKAAVPMAADLHRNSSVDWRVRVLFSGGTRRLPNITLSCHQEDELRAELDRERALLAEHTLDNPRKAPGQKTPGPTPSVLRRIPIQASTARHIVRCS
jgi:protein CpxP